MSKRRSGVARVGIGLATLVIALALAELCLRVARPRLVGLDRQPSIFRPDPELGYRFLPGADGVIQRLEFQVALHVNDAGFFDDEFALERNGATRRLAILGDSFTAGFHVGRGFNFPDVLEARLNEGATGWEVMNFGMVGTGTVHHARLFREVVPAYDPDVVLLAFFENDIDDVRQGIVLRDSYRDHALVYVEPEQRSALVARVDAFEDATPRWVRAGVTWSFLARALYAAWTRGDNLTLMSNRVRADELHSRTVTRAEAEAEVLALVVEMARACADEGRAFLVVAIPAKEEAHGERASAAQGVLDELAACGIPVHPLGDAFRSRTRAGERLYWKHDGHCNAAGYALIAAEVYRRMGTDGLLREGGPR